MLLETLCLNPLETVQCETFPAAARRVVAAGKRILQVPDGPQALQHCRIGGGSNLVPILDLGEQALSGVFPSDPRRAPRQGPLQLVWCPESELVQLAHSYPPAEMFGDNYGYRSGLNQAMVRHLTDKIQALERLAGLKSGDVVLDIGSNDATSLKAYSVSGLVRWGMDPTGRKFAGFYPPGIGLVPDFFSAAAYRDAGGRPARVVTSIAMLYDLEDPIAFAREVACVLAPDGLWHFEQSYLPAMLARTAYDTVCHEHLEYYSLKVVRRILDAAGLRVLDVETNDVNGGSFAVTAVHLNDPRPARPAVASLAAEEERLGLDTLAPYQDFAGRVRRHGPALLALLRRLAAEGASVLGYGASTKGNVLLQFCGVTAAELPAIAEVNSEKYGKYTPGTNIPIISEAEAHALRPDYFLVLPWHFRAGILEREAAFLARGGRLIFPLPEIEICAG